MEKYSSHREAYRRILKGNQGVTLVELLVSIAILALVVAPFLGSFLSAERNNQLSKDRLTAAAAAQKAMEKIKATPSLVDEAVNQTVNLKSYVPDGFFPEGYEVNYSVTEVSQGISTGDPAYTFQNLEDIPDNIVLTIDKKENEDDQYAVSGKFYYGDKQYKSTNIDMGEDAEDNRFTLTINKNGGDYDCDFFKTQGEAGNKNTVIANPEGKYAKIFAVKVVFKQEASPGLTLAVKVDSGVDKDVCFYIAGDSVSSPKLTLVNDNGEDFYTYYNISTNSVDTGTGVYRIEVRVTKNGEPVDSLVSYVNR
ncbi:MAG: prepilin-type N-terminal cleavage/methylation domain-containing protein [Clostridiales bacterium]|jgi:prepilin-type N-terminal cleavage/methylation domain-containing protein|nr:prepilin-type N-terminal cleavage/methylation domain-containing protein [Eubacteriales bacterium]MDH7565251.1 prepilin-type N-terminal cleavage/methylation domain-containing protein [Clostridiales bacterium]